jgi:ketosteroid isomerase-like protein
MARATCDTKATPRGAALSLSLAVTVALCVVVTTAPVRSQPRQPPDEIRAFLDRFIAAFDNLDWPAFIEMFDDDATIFYPSPPNAPIRATGRQQFEPVWRRVFQGIRGTRTTPPFMDLQPERLHVQLLTDIAIVTFELHDMPGLTGRRTLILHRHHGLWRIAHLHASNVPTPSAQ